mmetsp:Transcript_11274/g.36012  ORF Transcript_11274/g.36012 Transcript_11274/m.36012 type:complete len:251 (+) Transcript_11274:105-857(+)
MSPDLPPRTAARLVRAWSQSAVCAKAKARSQPVTTGAGSCSTAVASSRVGSRACLTRLRLQAPSPGTVARSAEASAATALSLAAACGARRSAMRPTSARLAAISSAEATGPPRAPVRMAVISATTSAGSARSGSVSRRPLETASDSRRRTCMRLLASNRNTRRRSGCARSAASAACSGALDQCSKRWRSRRACMPASPSPRRVASRWRALWPSCPGAQLNTSTCAWSRCSARSARESSTFCTTASSVPSR